MSSALDRLAELAGIQPAYHDIWGRTHTASPDTRRALLGAMGIACGDEAAAQASLRRWEEAEWRRLLPPVLVARPGEGAWTVTLHLPARDIGRPGRWRLDLEAGEPLGGEFHPGSLAVLGRRSLAEGEHLALELPLPAVEALGYHQLVVTLDGLAEARMPFILCPPACYQPEAIRDDRRAWGVSAQLYGVRAERNWGMGDLTDLRTLVEWAAAAGAGLVGVNPLHALFPHNPQHASPYSPSSRQFLNVLYIDVEAVPEFAECAEARAAVAEPEFQARLRALSAAPLVDYAGVAEAKLGILSRLYAHFRERHLAADTPRGRDFRRYQAEQDGELHHQALFEALQAHFHAGDRDVWGWPAWPEAYRDAHGEAVARWAEAHEDEVEWFQYLQWLAAGQLHAAGQRSYELGLDVGLYQDLAVGVDRGGAETWMHRDLYAFEASVGAPPDDFNLHGQDWGLPPFIPHRLREAAYGPYIRMLRANMREAGALRIDHVMGLMRLYWVPPGMRADEGVYVSYPFEDLMAILALESTRNRCLVIGEDLGTVPEAVRETMHAMGILAYRLFYFEKHWEGDQAFKAPGEITQEALVAASTHDLPTLAGFWRGLDLDLRSALGLFPTEAQREAQIVGRAEDRARLLVALEREGLLPEGMAVHPVTVPEVTPALAQAIHQYLARSPARILLVQAEDMLGETEQANLPGTTSGHPNWQRKLSLNLEEWPGDARLVRFAEVMVAERGTSVTPRPAPQPLPCSPANAPRATYRLQLHEGFGFREAQAILPYLAALGVSHVYCSPILRARPGSQHGYDIIDHNSLNPEIGSEADFEAYAEALEAHGLRLVLDIVPNHMGVMGADNGWWLDVLENGQAAEAAEHFDIDWQPVKDQLQGKVLVPVLGDHYGAVLERGELRLAFDAGAGEFSVWYWQHRFPVDPQSYPQILGHRMEELGARLGAEHPDHLEYQSLATAFSHLPAGSETEPDKRTERRRDQAIHKRHLASLAARNADILYFLQENVALFNVQPGEPAGIELMDRLLAAQAYRLAYWRVASDEINYRRFFDINDLAALRMEREAVFAQTHRLLGELFASGRLDAVRIDHSDGLYAPGAYFARLQRLYREARPTAAEPPYIVVEKILAPHERLPAAWAICGTTGYEFANLVNGLFVDPGAAEAMERAWRAFSGIREPFEETLYQAKRTIMKSALASELNMLANRLARIAEIDRHTRDYTLIALRGAIMEVAACFPVYRTYIGDGPDTEEDRRHVEWACAVARKRSKTADVSVFDFVREVLLATAGEGKHEDYRRAVSEFAMRFQQFSAPVMAKGMEDTASYRYHRLASLNEVGGEPRRFGVTAAAFHHANQERARHTPLAMLATSTHDSKRSEDVRARIDVLSELPAEWRRMVTRWHRLNRSRLGWVDGTQAPSRADEYLLYQTLLGSWPLEEGADYAEYARRIQAYMVKAVREAKQASSWINPDADYEARLGHFAESVLPPKASPRFLQEFLPFVRRIAHFGRLNSLAQTLLKLTAPGVPDLYQGSELWTDSLVDPDNRRPVDYDRRAAMLAALDKPARDMLQDLESGEAKLHVIRTALALRRERPELFARGDYLPLTPEGPAAAHAVAFARTWQDEAVVVLAPRLAYTLLGGETALPQGAVWQDTALALPWTEGAWRNALTGSRLMLRGDAEGARLELAEALSDFPVALLVREDRE